jgi:hypothetical protein
MWGARSRRQIFSSALTGDSEIDDVLFARWGPDASFHGFDIALGQARDLDVVSNKQDFLRARNPALFAHSLTSRAPLRALSRGATAGHRCGVFPPVPRSCDPQDPDDRQRPQLAFDASAIHLTVTTLPLGENLFRARST